MARDSGLRDVHGLDEVADGALAVVHFLFISSFHEEIYATVGGGSMTGAMSRGPCGEHDSEQPLALTQSLQPPAAMDRYG